MVRESTPLRIAFIVTDLPHSRTGGIAKVAGQIAQGLTELGQEVVCYCLRRTHQPSPGSIGGVQVRYVSVPFSLHPDYPVLSFSYRALRAACRDHEKRRYDIVQTFNINAAALPRYRARLHARGCALVHASFETIAMDIQAKWDEFRSLPSLSCLLQISGEAVLQVMYEARYLRAADLLITEDHHTRNALLRYGIAGERIRMIPSGVDLDAAQQAGAVPAPWSRAQYGPILGYLGRVDPRKGVQYLLAAMPRILKAYPRALLFLAGGSRQRYARDIRNQIRKLGLEEHVHLFGQVPGSLLPYYRLADVALIPSLSEGIPITLMEAMACRVPVVISRLPGVVPFLQHQDIVYWAEPGQADDLARAILDAIGDPDRRRKVERAWAFVQSFSWRDVAARYLDAYRGLSMRGSPPSV